MKYLKENEILFIVMNKLTKESKVIIAVDIHHARNKAIEHFFPECRTTDISVFKRL
jgi:hypothetical protein